MVLEGIAELPLHNGHVPEALLRRMKKLGSLIARFIVETYGPRVLLERLADPLWFQAFNNVIGMDWDSSGSTTIVLYVLKSSFPPESAREEGLAVLGGKGGDARNIPEEAGYLRDLVDPEQVVLTSRLSAKVDSVALQDGYTLYIHAVLVTENGLLVVQQGMNLDTRLARRYHILLEKPGVYTIDDDPHSGVASMITAPALNLVNEESRSTRKAILDILQSTPVDSLLHDVHRVNRALRRLPSLEDYVKGVISTQPGELGVKVSKCPLFYRPIVNTRNVGKVAEEIKKAALREFSELLLIPGLGPETLRAIALVADLIYGYEPSFKDPTTHPLDPFLYAYAHGGKDGVPYRIKPKDVDKTIEFFANVLASIKTGDREKEVLLRNFSRMVRRISYRYGLDQGTFQA
ncbi:MAG: DUF763 domain-containing protein [Desulfurococcaceae archaeon]